MKKFVKKGFTLIELMIVVVILGVLMSTVLPKLTGAQARARDAGRLADMNNIATALMVYYDDNGVFPGESGTGECLDEADGEGSSGLAIASYLEGSKVPKDPQVNANKWLCDGDANKGKYWYVPIEKNGIEANGYILCTDAETFQKANTDLATIAGEASNSVATLIDDTYANYSSSIGIEKFDAEADTASQSGICILN